MCTAVYYFGNVMECIKYCDILLVTLHHGDYMTLQQLRYVWTIYRSGSISKASHELSITQPYLSITLKLLEEELGIKIFSRHKSGVQLTQDGRRFLDYAKELLLQENKILEHYTNHKKNSLFRFSVATQHYPFVIKSMLSIFNLVNPKKFELCISETNMHSVIDRVFNKRNDIGVIFLTRDTEGFILKYLSKRGMRFNKIINVSPCVFFRKDHPMAHNEKINLIDMIHYPLACFESEISISSDFSEEFYYQGMSDCQQKFIINDRGTMINILTHTDSFSVGTGILSQGFAGGELISRPIINYNNVIQIGWVDNLDDKNNDLTKIINCFVDEIKQSIENNELK